MKKLTKTVSWSLFGLSAMIISPVAYVLFDEFLYEFEECNVEPLVEPNSRAISVLARKESNQDAYVNVSEVEMISGGLTSEEAEILYILEVLLGELSNKEIEEYLNLPHDEYRSETIRRLLPGVISESIKYGIRPGNSLTQALMELGWETNSKSCIDCYTNNVYGIEATTQPSIYWSGKSDKLKNGKLVRKYDSLWHCSMDHGLQLTETKYSRFNILSERSPREYAKKLCEVKYYDLESNEDKEEFKEEYSKQFEKLFKENNLDKLDTLVADVNRRLKRTKGTRLSPNGVELKEGEWKPETVEVFGYFINPEDVQLENKNSPVVNNKSGSNIIAWDFNVVKESLVLSSKSGKVNSVNKSKGIITIEHNDGTMVTYSNVCNIILDKNDNVYQGDRIGKVYDKLRIEISKKDSRGKVKSVSPSLYFKSVGKSYSIKYKSSFDAYRRVVNSLGYYDGSTKDVERDSTPKITLVSNFSGSESLNNIKPIYTPDNSWVTEFKVDLNSLSEKRMKILEEATVHLGKSYLWAANGPNKFDCSGYTRWVYKKALGVDLPRHSAHQVECNYMEEVTLEQAKSGDLVFIPAGGRRSCNHIGIFIRDMNDDYIILMHAPCKRDRVKVYKYPKSNGLHYYRLTGVDR